SLTFRTPPFSWTMATGSSFTRRVTVILADPAASSFSRPGRTAAVPRRCVSTPTGTWALGQRLLPPSSTSMATSPSQAQQSSTPMATGWGIPPDSLARLARLVPLALQEPMERMERMERRVQLVYPVRLESTAPMEQPAQQASWVLLVQPVRLEQPVSYRASPPPGFSSPTRAARARLTRARLSC